MTYSVEGDRRRVPGGWPRRRRRSAALPGGIALAALAALACSCAVGPTPPPRAPFLEETRESASGMLARAYPDWATGIGPVPGRVVGLLLPAESRWGRSLEWIGEGIVRNPGAYAPLGPERVRIYELYAHGVSPRIVWFGVPDAPGSERAVRTLDGDVRSFPVAVLAPGKRNRWGLRSEAHLAALEVAGGEGQARGSQSELVATRVDLLDGQPGYPRSVVELLDGARAMFDRFVEDAAPRVASLLREGAASAEDESGVPAREHVTRALFPYWDDERRRLVVLFHRSVLRLTEYSVPCQFVYEGMPPETRSFVVRHSYGVELGQELELDAAGVLVALRSFEPAGFRIPSNAPAVEPSAKPWPVVCPGSPGIRRPSGEAPELRVESG